MIIVKKVRPQGVKLEYYVIINVPLESKKILSIINVIWRKMHSSDYQ
jgi:hypothetical protein